MTRICVLDFETTYSREYSLTKLTTEHYVRDPQFQVIGCAFKFDSDKAYWVADPDAVRGYIAEIDWSDTIIVGQNTAFDGFILSHYYDVKPKAWLDIMGMSRALFPHEKSHSLASQAQRAGIGAKGDEVVNALGKRYEDFTPEQLTKYGEYCINDVELTHQLFMRYMGMGFPKKELHLIDLTLRMFIEPVLELDRDLLVTHLAKVRSRKQELLERVRDNLLASADPDTRQTVFASGLEGVKTLLMSNPKFADALRGLGVEPPMKISPTTGKETYAFAKSDEAFKALEEHPSEDVQALVAARLGTKSTIEETRTETLIDYAARGLFPIALRYYGAHTGRWCLTGDHEVLTPNGWVRLDQWSGEPIKQWDSETKQLTWCASPKVSSFDTDEPLVEFTGKYHRAMYTNEHRLPIRKRHTPDSVRDITAGRFTEIVKKELYVSGFAVQEGVRKNPDMLRLIVAMHADGYNVQDARNNMVRFRFTRRRKIERLKVLLESLRIPYSAHNYPSEAHVTAIVIRGDDAPDWLRAAKTLPDWFYALGGEDAAVIVEEIPHWDGSRATDNSFEWSGKDEDAAAKYATLAHQCGYRALVSLRPRADMGWADTWRVNFVRATTITDGKDNTRWAPFNGTVYCPTVDTGYFMCRRQGTIFMTGNSAESSAKVNMQNLPRNSKIKDAIKAPDGFVLCGADLSNIELRLGLWLAGQDDRVKMLANGLDLYKDFAKDVFGVPYDDVTKEQRQVGKVSNLSLIYGTGPAKLREALRVMGGVVMTIDQVKPIVDLYRSRYACVKAAWKIGDDALHALVNKQTMELYRGTCRVEPEHNGIRLPNGLHIQYPGLRRVTNEEGKAEWVFDSKYGPERIYGSKVFQGCTQAIARCIMGEGLLRIQKWSPVRLTIHDSAYWLALEGEAEASLARGIACITAPVPYCPGLPLAAEGDWGKSLADC